MGRPTASLGDPNLTLTSQIPWLITGTTNVPAEVKVMQGPDVIFDLNVPVGDFQYGATTLTDGNSTETPTVQLIDNATGNTFASGAGSAPENNTDWLPSAIDAPVSTPMSQAVAVLIDQAVDAQVSFFMQYDQDIANQMFAADGSQSVTDYLHQVDNTINAYGSALRTILTGDANTGITLAINGEGGKATFQSDTDNPNFATFQGFMSSLPSAISNGLSNATFTFTPNLSSGLGSSNLTQLESYIKTNNIGALTNLIRQNATVDVGASIPIVGPQLPGAPAYQAMLTLTAKGVGSSTTPYFLEGASVEQIFQTTDPNSVFQASISFSWTDDFQTGAQQFVLRGRIDY